MAKRDLKPTIFDHIDFPDPRWEEYPKMLYGYHPDGRKGAEVTVNSAVEEEALGPLWYKSPGEVPNQSAASVVAARAAPEEDPVDKAAREAAEAEAAAASAALAEAQMREKIMKELAEQGMLKESAKAADTAKKSAGINL